MDRYEEPDCAVAKVQRAVGNFAGLKTLNNNTPFLDTVSITSDSAAQIWLFVPEDTILVMYSNPSRGDSLLIATYRTDFTDDYWNTEGRGLVFSGTDSLYLDYTTIVGNDGIYDTTRHVFIGKRF
ncbi:MAG: hypothetical protein SFW35_03825 [Chitinophagales bacterium]|nr:hypothetical protein [Chitinophagales bacterium]